MRTVCFDCGSALLPPSEKSLSEARFIGLRIRLLTGAWFGGAAVIPIVFSVVTLFNFGFVLLGVVPVSTAFLFGFICGAGIVDRSTTPGGKSAVLRGAVVAGLSFFSYQTITYAFLAALGGTITFYGFLYFSVLGLIFFGWLALLVGAIAGYLLFKISSNPDFSRWIDEVPKTNAIRFGHMIAISLLMYALITAALLGGTLFELAKKKAQDEQELAISSAVNHGQAEELKEILSKPDTDRYFKNGTSSRWLKEAAFAGKAEIISILVENGADPNHMEPYDSLSALGHAAGRNDVMMMSNLVRAGADVNLSSPNEGITPLMYAAPRNNFEAVRFLLERGAEVNRRDSTGMTALGRVIEHRKRNDGVNSDGKQQFPELMLRTDEMIDLLKAHGAVE